MFCYVWICWNWSYCFPCQTWCFLLFRFYFPDITWKCCTIRGTFLIQNLDHHKKLFLLTLQVIGNDFPYESFFDFKKGNSLEYNETTTSKLSVTVSWGVYQNLFSYVPLFWNAQSILNIDVSGWFMNCCQYKHNWK